MIELAAEFTLDNYDARKRMQVLQEALDRIERTLAAQPADSGTLRIEVELEDDDAPILIEVRGTILMLKRLEVYLKSRTRQIEELKAAQSAPAVPPGYALVLVESLRRWRDAFAEELAAYDIDPPIHHVETSHDEIDAMLAAAAGDKP